MDKSTRNTLRSAVTQCRRLLEDVVAESLEGRFGIHKNAAVEAEEGLTHLSEPELQRRAHILEHLNHAQAGGLKGDRAVARLVREVAFTHLNRLVAYKMMETRGLIREAVSRGALSQGFLFYLADHPEEAALRADGLEYDAYCHFLDSLGESFAAEIAALFSPTDPANGLYPSDKVLQQVLGLINQDDLASIWAQDEAIGWVYQYFTPKELRDQSRKESSAPRDSYELAFRNQFYTPRYVVEFLVDNTLGRLWYEMYGPTSELASRCAYLAPPADDGGGAVRVRDMRDPRAITVLDPACGSGHFLLYCFDLLERMYAEAYAHPVAGAELRTDFPDPRAFKLAVPGLILRFNLHGIDIDPRAVQIAALALWLRAQRSYLETGLGRDDRPPINRANIVCAEPMPGEADLLSDFLEDLNPPLLQRLVRDVFGRMELAAEAGSLLRVEEELRASLREARSQWLARPRQEQLELMPQSRTRSVDQLSFDVTGITDAEFWHNAEDRVMDALEDFAREADVAKGYLRRLFADDAARGFSFIDLCRARYDVVLMNPPFGEASPRATACIELNYPDWAKNLLCAFIMRAHELTKMRGFTGVIFDRTASIKSSYERFRRRSLNDFITVCADTGWGVLDAEVETTVHVLSHEPQTGAATFIDVRQLDPDEKAGALQTSLLLIREGRLPGNAYVVW